MYLGTRCIIDVWLRMQVEIELILATPESSALSQYITLYSGLPTLPSYIDIHTACIDQPTHWAVSCIHNPTWKHLLSMIIIFYRQCTIGAMLQVKVISHTYKIWLTSHKLQQQISTLRILACCKAKIAKICNFWTYWPGIQLINHLFKIRQKVTALFTSKEHWTKGLFVGYWIYGLLAEL